MAVAFNIQFRINEKTQSRVIRLTDTSTGFTFGKGIFLVTFPDGSTRGILDFNNPDITASGAFVDVLAVTDANSNVLTGTYTIKFVVTNSSGVEQTPLQRQFDFNWIIPSNGLTNLSDSIIPEVKFSDATSYGANGSFTGAETKTISTTLPSNTAVSGTVVSTTSSLLDVKVSNNYYEGVYTVTNDLSVLYTHSSNSWLTIQYNQLFSSQFDVRQAPNQLQLITKINTYKDFIDSLKNLNVSKYEILSEEYDIVVSLYSHLITRYQAGLLDGSQSILTDLLGYLEPYVPHTYQSTPMTAFTLANNATSSFTITDGANNSNIALGDTLLFSSALAGLGLVVSNDKLTLTAKGTSSQFLKADGSIDSSVYLTGITSGQVVSALGYTPYNATNPNGYISGITSLLVTNALGYTPYNAANPNGYTSNLGTVTSVAALTLGTTGTDLSSSVATGTTTPVITLNVPTASATNRGVLSSSDWTTFNNKQSTITLTTTGTSGAATLVGNVLNIPQYTGGSGAVTSFNTRTGAITLSSSDVTSALGYTPENSSNKGVANGYASLDGSGLVPSTQLPSYVDDVLEYTNLASFPVTGTTGKIYVDLATNKIYRWSGSTYIEVSPTVGTIWGGITGTLSNQTDLQNALNAKQNTLTNPVTGTGTTSYLPKFTGTSTIGDSLIYDNGSGVGIGTTSLTGINFNIAKNITGSTVAYNTYLQGTIQSDVTATAIMLRVQPNTQATAFTLTDLFHVRIGQGTFGAGSAVTNQYGYYVENTLTGATNNFGFYGNLAAASNVWNLYMIGSANNYMTGSLGISSTSLTGYSLRVSKNITGGVNAYGIRQDGIVQSDVTTAGFGIINALNTQATTFTVGTYNHYQAIEGTIGAGSTVSVQVGYSVSTLSSGTSNWGFRGSIASGTGRYNLYMDGTADNYLAGALGIGSTAIGASTLLVKKNITGATTYEGVTQQGTVQSDVTTVVNGFANYLTTAAASFTLAGYRHFIADQSTIGSGSVITNQFGFLAAGNLTGATNNYGFYGNIASGTGRWNLYMSGTASNYMAGALGIGSTPSGLVSLSVTKALTGSTGGTIGIQQSGQVQSDVTNVSYGFYNDFGTQALPFTLTTYRNFYAGGNATLGQGSIVTIQRGFEAGGYLGATNNYGFYGNAPLSRATSATISSYSITTNVVTLTTSAAHTIANGSRITVNITSLTSAATLVVGVAYRIVSVGTTDFTTVGAASNTVGLTFTATGTTYTGSGTLCYPIQGGNYLVTGVTSTTLTFALTASDTTGSVTVSGGTVTQNASWNLYMVGAGDNYLAGSLGIGTTSFSTVNLYVSKAITGGTTAYNIYGFSTIQSDVTGNAYMYRSLAATQAASFTLSNLYHYNATQSTIGAGSTVTNQYGFFVDSTLTGATNDYGFFGNLAAGTNIWNLYMNGTANNYMAGSLGVGSTSLTSISFRNAKTITGGTISYSNLSDGQIQSDVTNQAYIYLSNPSTQAATFTLGNLYHYSASQSTFGAGTTVTNQYGFFANSNLTGATNDYGFYGNLAAGTNIWNLYMAGTANNYLAGSLGIGTTSVTGYSLRVSKNLTGSTVPTAILAEGAVQSDATSLAAYFYTNGSVAATAFTLPSLYHFRAGLGLAITTATVTNQYGFFAENTVVGATNNYGFYGNIASATNNWNLYMNGTANNYLAGNLWIGTTGGTYKLDVVGDINTSTAFRIAGTSYTVASSTSSGFLTSTDWNTFNNKGTVTSVGGTGTAFGLTLTGTVTTSGNLTLGGTLAVPVANITATGTPSSTTYLRGDGAWVAVAGGGGGTVTDVSIVSANGFAGTVATSTSTPAITLSTTITGILKGNGTAISAAVAGTDYVAPSALSNYVPTTRTLNTLALSSDQTFAVGTSGTNFNISSSAGVHTFNIPDASASNRGLVTTGTQTFAGAKTFSSTLTASSTMSINGGTLTGNNLLSIRSNSTGGQVRIERNDGSLCMYPFYVGSNGNPASYFYATDGTTLRIVFQIDTPSYFYNKLAIGQATWTAASAITEMVEVNGYVKATGFKTGGTSAQFLKADGSVDSSTYLTANQTITLSGAVTGSGTTAITTTLANSVVGVANLSATGTPSATTYLRGDNTWATITSGGTVTSVSGTGTAFGLTLTGTVTTSGSLTLAGTLAVPIANITATGTPSATTYLRGDNTWATISGGSASPAGANTQIQFNNSGAFGASTGLTWDGTSITATNSISSGGTAAYGAFTPTFTDGIVLDYVSGYGRISVGGGDGIQFFNGGVGGALLGSATSGGDWDFNGNLTIGTGTTITGAVNPILAIAASSTGYVQAYIHNDNSGTSSSSDIACYPDNGVDTSGWIDMGITSSTYSDASYTTTGANEGYIFMSAPSGASKTGNLVFATDSTGTQNYFQWYVGGFGQAKSAFKMQLKSTALDLSVQLNSTVATGTAPFTVASTTQVANLFATKAATVSDGSIGIASLSATGTPSSTTYLRGDNTWATISSSSFNGVLTAGTATVAPLEFTNAGSVLKTSPLMGDIESDTAGIFYYTHANSSRGVVHAEQFISLTTAYTLTSQTAAQKMFNSTTNGAVTVQGATTYYFECFYSLSSMSATTGSFGFALGGTATFTSLNWTSQALKATTQTTAATMQTTFNTTAANTTIVTTSTATAGYARITGTIRVNAGGTVIPQVSLGVAAAAIVGANSYFRIIPIGTNTVTSIGNWS